jgi:hypothetical protein
MLLFYKNLLADETLDDNDMFLQFIRLLFLSCLLFIGVNYDNSLTGYIV